MTESGEVLGIDVPPKSSGGANSPRWTDRGNFKISSKRAKAHQLAEEHPASTRIRRILGAGES